MYDIENRIMKTAEYISSTGCTVRQAAEMCGISKSTVHKDMSERLKKIDPDMYDKVESVLKHNKEVRHLRGGEATKNKYLSMRKN